MIKCVNDGILEYWNNRKKLLNKFLIANCQLPTANCRLKTTNCQLIKRYVVDEFS